MLRLATMNNLYLLLLIITLSACLGSASEADIARLEKLIRDMQDQHKTVISALAHQVQMQQLYMEELTRSSSDSGLKQLRLDRVGTRSYHTNTFTSSRMAAVHDHPNYQSTAGMGEFVAVLNGVEFRTRHNDYSLNMPHTTSKIYGATEPIAYPNVPPEVLAKPTVDGQIKEMREWFKAWKNQDFSQRDYRMYFRPVLCYLEGMWTFPNKSGNLDEPFASDRHSIDASSWLDLQEKIMFTGSTGRKDSAENLAFLPTKIVGINNEGFPVYSQWNYQILCHPLKEDIPLNRFRVVDDISNRLPRGKTLEEYGWGREARFQVYPDLAFNGVHKQDHYLYGETYLDKLMQQIPGKDNYPADLVDDAFNLTAYHLNATFASLNTSKPMNVGYYHRTFKTYSNDAMGVTHRFRGYSDASLYVALNTQAKIPSSKMNYCKTVACSTANQQSNKCKQVCTRFEQRVSYAIPLEIIFMTPLGSWNPYNIVHLAKLFDPVELNRINGTRRDGSKTKEGAYAGKNNYFFYQTPAEFFTSKAKIIMDRADTAVSDSVGVLDANGTVREVSPSGLRVVLSNIPGVGNVRLRYPIAPISHAGHMIYKEVDAIKELLLKSTKYRRLFPDVTLGVNGTHYEQIFTFELQGHTKDGHSHSYTLSESDIKRLRSGKSVTVETSAASGHDHELVVMFGSWFDGYGRFIEAAYIFECDGRKRTCWDGHTGSTPCIDCYSGFPNPQ